LESGKRNPYQDQALKTLNSSFGQGSYGNQKKQSVEFLLAEHPEEADSELKNLEDAFSSVCDVFIRWSNKHGYSCNCSYNPSEWGDCE